CHVVGRPDLAVGAPATPVLDGLEDPLELGDAHLRPRGAHHALLSLSSCARPRRAPIAPSQREDHRKGLLYGQDDVMLGSNVCQARERGVTGQMRICAAGDSYIPSSYFQEAFAGLEQAHDVDYFQIDPTRPFHPVSPSERGLREYQGTPAELA